MGAGFLCLLVAACLWLRVPSLPAEGISGSVPIAPGHAILVSVWTHDLAFSPQYTSGGLTRQTPGLLRMSVGYTHPPFATEQRLAVFVVPAWPAALAGAMLVSAGGWLWRTSRPAAPPGSSGGEL